MSQIGIEPQTIREETISWPDADFAIVRKPISYKFSEDKYLDELKSYINETYSQHYATAGKVQTTEYILDQCTTPDYLRGNILKYTARYGFKNGYDRKDILKLIHYGILMLHNHDKRYGNSNGN